MAPADRSFVASRSYITAERSFLSLSLSLFHTDTHSFSLLFRGEEFAGKKRKP